MNIIEAQQRIARLRDLARISFNQPHAYVSLHLWDDAVSVGVACDGYHTFRAPTVEQALEDAELFCKRSSTELLALTLGIQQ